MVAWAPSNADGLPDERDFIVRVLVAAAERTTFDLWIFGVKDEGAMQHHTAELSKRGIGVRCYPPMRFDSFYRILSGADIGLNPLCEDTNTFAAGKSFGKTLAYLACGLAVVTTPTVDHPLFFEDGINGFMCESTEDWARRVIALVDDRELRRSIVESATRDFERRLHPSAAAQRFATIVAAIPKRDSSARRLRVAGSTSP